MKLYEIISAIEEFAPPQLQESYDNSGLNIGNFKSEINAVLLCIDVTEEIIDEAISKSCNLIISHHPLIFKGIKKLNESNSIERIVSKAIKNDIAIYCCHTSIDSVINGVNGKIADKIGLRNRKILFPVSNILKKIVCYVPTDYAEKVRNAMFAEGAGNIGKYANCSYNMQGEGTFLAGPETNPFAGKVNKMHFENEIRIETIAPSYKVNGIIANMIKAHPYEEVAYDIYPLENKNIDAGMGIFGELDKTEKTENFLKRVKDIFQCKCIKHTYINKDNIKKVAVCGGSGSFLTSAAISEKADIFISGDFKYHDFFNAENKIIIADIGHYESEQFTKEIFYELLTKKFPNFAVRISEINTNPINYL